MFKLNKIKNNQITTFLTDHMHLFLLIPLFFISLPMIAPGVIMYGDFPLLETSLYSGKFLSTWIDFGSHHGFETLARYPIITMGVLLNSISISGEIISKFLIILGFFTASFSFYFSSVILFKSKFSNHDLFFKISAILGALFYAYNVWSFHRIHHWYLWLGYATLPLFVVLLIRSFNNPTKWKYVVAAVLIWTLASSTPHMVIFYGIFYIGISLYFVLRNVSHRAALLRTAIPLTSIISFYLLLNLFWIYPYTLYAVYSGQGSLLPSILVTEELTKILSRDNVFLNVLRLIQDWWEPRIIEVTPPQTSILYNVWLVASFVPPVLVFSALLLKRNSKIMLFFLAITMIGILLTLGTNAPFNLYSLILFDSPLFAALKYVFRDPDKWAFMIGIGYSFLLSISVFEILKRVNSSNYKHKALMSYAFISVVLVSFAIYCYPTYNSTAQKVFDSVTIPSEYNQLNTFLQNNHTERIFFMFQDFGPTIWHRQGEFYGFEQRYSDKPNIMAYQYLPISENYHDYLQNSILLNKSSNIGNLIYPLGTSYLVYSNDELGQNNTKLKFLSMPRDIKKIANFGFINVYKVGNDNVGEFNIPKQVILVSGGLNMFNSFDYLPTFTTLNSSLIFLDQSLSKEQKYRAMGFGDYLALEKGGDDLILSFLDEKYFLKPFEFTNHGDPSKMWSKDSALDIIHGQFHPYSKKLGVENWDFDYGKGLVMTDSTGANLSIPIDMINRPAKVEADNSELYLFVRYLQNQKGGQVNIYLDDKLLNSIDTLDRKSNNFVWENIGSVSLTGGKHNLALENIAGFNAVNLVALVSGEQLENLRSETIKTLGERSSIFYPMEAETHFYNDNAIDVSSGALFRDNNSSLHNTTNITKTFSGQFRAPENSDYVELGFLAENTSNNDAKSLIRDIKISPSSNILNKFSSDFEKEKNYVLLSDFDNERRVVQPENSSASNWMNNQKDILSTSLETGGKKNFGNESLKVDIKQGNFSYWGTISTDFIPIRNNAFYDYKFEISARDVNKLHSKVYYYDSSKRELDEDFAFDERTGSFEFSGKKSLLPPSGSSYLKLQFWVAPNLMMNSSYFIDNVNLDEIIPNNDLKPDGNFTKFKNNFDVIDSRLIEDSNNLTETSVYNANFSNNINESRIESIENGYSNDYKISTRLLPIQDNHDYNYTITLWPENASSVSSITTFKSSQDVIVNATKYGGKASNGMVISMAPGSKIHSKLDIIRPSNYSVALRANTCHACTFLITNLTGENNNKSINTVDMKSNISLAGKNPELKWLFSNSSTFLNDGSYELEIYSDSQTDLDSVIVYDIGNVDTSGKSKNTDNGNIFNPGVSISSTLSEDSKLSPTKYNLEIKNATKPYMLTFSESYDPQWIAYINKDHNNESSIKKDNYKTDSIPLYSIVNGFYINKTGSYTLTVEYQPQEWFIQAGTASLVVLISAIGILLLVRYLKYLKIKRK